MTYDDLDVGEGHFDFFTKKNKKRDPDKNKNGRDVVVAVDGSLFRHHPHYAAAPIIGSLPMQTDSNAWLAPTIVGLWAC